MSGPARIQPNAILPLANNDEQIQASSSSDSGYYVSDANVLPGSVPISQHFQGAPLHRARTSVSCQQL